MTSWQHFWNENDIFDDIMTENFQVFKKVFPTVVPFNESDLVLDFGCGQGHHSQWIADKVEKVVAVDTAARFIQENKSRSNKVEFKQIQDHTELRDPYNKYFSFILCHSVVQYFKDLDHVSDLFETFAHITKPKARVVVCDIIPKEGASLSTIPSFLWHSFKSGVLLKSITLLFKARMSSYYKLSKRKAVLTLSKTEIKQLAEPWFKAEFIDQSATLNTERYMAILERK